MRMNALFADESILVGHVILEGGERVAEEIHAAQNEEIVVLRGRLAVRSGPVETALSITDPYLTDRFLSGVTLFIPAGISHAVQNDSAIEGAEYIAILRRVPEAT